MNVGAEEKNELIIFLRIPGYSHLRVSVLPLLDPCPLGCGKAGAGLPDHPGHVVSQQRPAQPQPRAHLALPLLLGTLGGLALGQVGLGLADHVDIQHLAAETLAVLPEARRPRVKRRGELDKRIALATLT